jgi:hypothetical protein
MRRSRGFEATAALVAPRIRQAGEGRGFAVSRVLTHWSEVVGDEIARLSRPIRIGYGRDGMGATLTLLCSGATAPLVQMQLETIRERVNACYGYNAIARVRITQSAPEGLAAVPGLADPAAPFAPAPEAVPPVTRRKAQDLTCGVEDPGLRAALETLARNVLSRAKSQKGSDNAD